MHTDNNPTDLRQCSLSYQCHNEKIACAIITAHDDNQPIEQGENARLKIREYGSELWQDRGVYTFEVAEQKCLLHCQHFARKARQNGENTKREPEPLIRDGPPEWNADIPF